MKNKSKIRAEKFKSKLKKVPQCSGCKSDNFHVSDYFGNIKMSRSLKLSPAGPYVPIVMLICKNCGLMSFYAVEALSDLD